MLTDVQFILEITTFRTVFFFQAELANGHTNLLAQFSFYISGFLDHVTALTLPQVRQIMDILSILAYDSPKVGQVLREDLQMVIRKQITSTGKTSSLKHIGVIAAVTTVKNMCKKSAVDSFASAEKERNMLYSQSSSNNNSTLVKQALDMLEMVKTATKSVGSAAGLFMDELASVFDAKSDQGDLHDDLIDWISEKMAKDFEEEYVEDVAEGDEDRVENTALVPLKLAYGIEYDNHLEANAIALNLGHMVASNKGSSAAKAARLIPHFR